MANNTNLEFMRVNRGQTFLIYLFYISTGVICAYGKIDVAKVNAMGKVLSYKTVNSKNNKVVVPEYLYIEPSTLHSLGFQWRIKGDENRNSRVEVYFRPSGSKKWKKGMDFLRMKREKVSWKKSQMEGVAPNMHAGSIMFLKSATLYVVKLKLIDPDGGGVEQIIEVPTKTLPKKYDGGKRLHVYPKKFNGKKSQPNFNDLTSAYENVNPGDRILIHSGQYTGLHHFDKIATRDKPIVIEAAGDGEVVFVGDFIQTGKRAVGNNWDERQICFDMSGSQYHWIEGITFKRFNYGVYVGGKMGLRELPPRTKGKKMINYSVQGELRQYDEANSKYGKPGEDRPVIGLTIQGCTFIDNGWSGIMIFHSKNRDLYIADNTCYGSAKHFVRKKKVLFPYKGIWVAGQGVDVCYNRTQYHKDGISFLQDHRDTNDVPFESKGCAIDFYNNDIGQSWDDNEADGADHNIRFFYNKLVDQAVGLSAQPIYGGPCYFIRNILYNSTYNVALKLNCEPSGVIAYHNTFIGGSSIGQNWSNCHIKNNIFIPQTDQSDSFRVEIIDPEISTLDYNAHKLAGKVIWRSKNGKITYKKNYSQVKKDGFEKHMQWVDYKDFVDIKPPQGEDIVLHHLNIGDPHLEKGSRLVDAGVLIHGVNDNYLGKAPDIGALERGQAMPHYGPRK